MEENLKCGFLHYYIPKIANKLLSFVFKDLKIRDFKFVWLICETQSSIYKVMGLKRFTELLDTLNIKDDFLKDYQKINSASNDLSSRFGDMRLVKLL